MVNSSRIKIEFSDIDPARVSKRPGAEPATLGRCGMAYITGALFFGDVDEFVHRMEDADRFDYLIISLRGMSSVDLPGAQAMHETCEALKRQGKTVVFCGAAEQVRGYFDREGVTELMGENSYYGSADQAILELLEKKAKAA
jgi:SulP family sulfate permease